MMETSVSVDINVILLFPFYLIEMCWVFGSFGNEPMQS